ncbi:MULTISPECIES: dihydrodipicolinate synthase family protein [Bacteroides]|jgi:dihydrodipicolinate synthase/N-acetylneuraminate lyase|uniref:dihydrodipicolinate synthase family protein n=1 Tax=Bacteroides TaxID=816 RepID=UPI000E44E918|nr:MULTISPECIES: dihydrodipicolinate synthase family protein [Bacteroides]MBS7573726.1 dihydrodipicolinate synthase family protein [Bacteroides propionicigenes]RGM28630.1 dihydrodipicolinate synthase family protein [Bacteroides sp. OM08-17BH]RHJ51650.1 dihydrodipicolinate synthase family protein [Bacteroides sp. AM10-21B]HBO07678.1 dihydrodipicolinate synthase family protein [Bacteroides sp.]
MDLRGIVTVINTPFRYNGEIDQNGLRKHLRYAIDSGVKGFLIPAMASEVLKLSESEKELLVGIALEEAGTEVAVVAGTSAYTRKERYENFVKFQAMGCRALLVNIPLISVDDYFDEISQLDKLSPEMIVIQDWDAGGYGLPLDFIGHLYREIESFKMLKVEVVPAGKKYTDVKKLTKGNLLLAGGWAVGQMIEGLERGVDCFMPTAMHEIYVRIYTLFQDGRKAEACELFEKILPILSYSNQHLDISIHFFKEMLYSLGIYETNIVREPILAIDFINREISNELIERYKTIRNSLYD